MPRASSEKRARLSGFVLLAVTPLRGICGIRGIRLVSQTGGFSSGRMHLNLPQDDLKSMVFFGENAFQDAFQTTILEENWPRRCPK